MQKMKDRSFRTTSDDWVQKRRDWPNRRVLYTPISRQGDDDPFAEQRD